MGTIGYMSTKMLPQHRQRSSYSITAWLLESNAMSRLARVRHRQAQHLQSAPIAKRRLTVAAHRSARSLSVCSASVSIRTSSLKQAARKHGKEVLGLALAIACI